VTALIESFFRSSVETPFPQLDAFGTLIMFFFVSRIKAFDCAVHDESLPTLSEARQP